MTDASAAAADETAAAPQPAVAPLTRRDRQTYFGVAALFTFLLLLPHYFSGGTWGPDFTTHWWMSWVQGQNLFHNGGPSLFLHFDKMGVFFPYYAFYGGSFYTIGGFLMQVVGSAEVVYILLYSLCFFSAYAGVLALSLMGGLRGWKAHLPSLVLVTGSFYLTNAFARGAYMEFAATSAIPVVVAASVSLLNSPGRLSIWKVIALLWGSIVFTGAHNISMSWGAVVLVGLIVTMVWALPRHGREFSVRRLVQVVAIGLLGVAANAWYLVPDIVYANNTQIANGTPFFHDISNLFNKPGTLFTPIRSMPKESTTAGLYTNLPILVILWTFVVFGLLARRSGREIRRSVIGMYVVLAGLLWLIMGDWPWDHIVPRALQFVQFSFRLQFYFLLVLALVVLQLLRATRNASNGKLPEFVLAGIAVFSIGIGIWQGWTTDSNWPITRSTVITKNSTAIGPATWYDSGSYRDATLPIVQTDPARALNIPPDQVKNDIFEGQVPLPEGSNPIVTNIAGGPYLVKITGPVKTIGRTADGWIVLERTDPIAPAGWVDLHIESRREDPVLAGRSITLLALLGILAFLGALATRRWWQSPVALDGVAGTGTAPSELARRRAAADRASVKAQRAQAAAAKAQAKAEAARAAATEPEPRTTEPETETDAADPATDEDPKA
ncbi:MAG: hypothetical protein PGN13_14755 [Patulibacter minatonensis]